jgi:hypothetical protein
MNEVGHLRKKIKKLKHRIFDEEEDTPQKINLEEPEKITPIEKPEDIEYEFENTEETVPVYRRVRRADLLNYKRFGF